MVKTMTGESECHTQKSHTMNAPRVDGGECMAPDNLVESECGWGNSWERTADVCGILTVDG